MRAMQSVKLLLSVVVGWLAVPLVVSPALALAAPDPGATTWVDIGPRAPVETPPGIATPEDAMRVSDHYDAVAARYRDLGGVGYKAGLVQRAERQSDRYAALAADLDAPPVVVTVGSSQADHYEALADHYESLGGAAWKRGLVQRARASAARYEPEPAPAPESPPLPEKPVEPTLDAPPR